jgi:signal transduction histidine kinase
MSQLLSRLRESSARQRRLVADASHELRTPLTILAAELELAGKPGRSLKELHEAVSAASDEVSRLQRLAVDLLFLARCDDGGVRLQVDKVSLNALAAQATQAASTRARSLGVSLTVKGPRQLEVRADPGRLRQAMDTLIDNALRFAPPGSEVVVGLHRRNGRALIEVSDSGPGFPESFLPHAFERFRRADAARARARRQRPRSRHRALDRPGARGPRLGREPPRGDGRAGAAAGLRLEACLVLM